MTTPTWKQTLISGYHKFRASDFKQQKENYSTLGEHGQSPKVMIVACSDSRVNPSAIFSAYPGEMFTHRNIANIVPPYEGEGGVHGASATIEFAVCALKVEAIVVMGHESCGGIAGYLDGLADSAETKFIGSWIRLLDDAHACLKENNANSDNEQLQMEFANVRQSLKNLMGFPFVAKAVEAGELSLLGAYFSIIKGKLLFCDDNGEFQEVPEKP